MLKDRSLPFFIHLPIGKNDETTEENFSNVKKFSTILPIFITFYQLFYHYLPIYIAIFNHFYSDLPKNLLQ
jgi:hypothetical protein